ncbi:MFS transporter [Rickettsia rickettsii]|uniref:MFS transporter n=2 Tax=Rickettsia TaxID=780 RepID=UPI0003025C81|nr:MFS transporter [Rickettsia philipii]
MAVILNELFFPETDARAASLYSAIAYCATYVFRPIGALIFGWIGDTIGRKATVIITTFLMSLCYLIMANYKNLCRNWYYGDFCSNCVSYRSGDVLYRGGSRCRALSNRNDKNSSTLLGGGFACCFCNFRCNRVALAVGTLVTSFGLDWRIAFWFGAAIAIVGAVVRTNLRETRDFIDAKRRIKKTVAQAGIDSNRLKSSPIWSEKINKPTAITFFLVHCGAPLWFYYC